MQGHLSFMYCYIVCIAEFLYVTMCVALTLFYVFGFLLFQIVFSNIRNLKLTKNLGL